MLKLCMWHLSILEGQEGIIFPITHFIFFFNVNKKYILKYWSKFMQPTLENRKVTSKKNKRINNTPSFQNTLHNSLFES